MQTMYRPTGAIERKNLEYFPCVSEIKELSATKYQIGGYLNWKNNLDLGRDITRDGAFIKTLRDAYARKAAGDAFLWPYLWNHNSTDHPPIGGIYEASEDASGLYVRVQFNPEIELARDVFSSLKMKTLSKQSMGYIAESVNWLKGEDGKGSARELLVVDIREGSTTLFPMNLRSTVDSVKNYWQGWSSKGQASGKTTWSLADRNTSWDGGQARKDIQAWADGDWSKVASCFFWVEQSPPENMSQCKMPFVARSGGTMKAIPAGIIACAGVIQGARGGAHIDDVENVKKKIAVYYHKMDMTPPWEPKSDWDYDGEVKEGRVLSGRTIAVLNRATSAIEKHTGDIQAHMAAMRAGQLQGYPLYSASDDSAYDIASALEALTAELEGKAGAAISAENHQTIAEATTNIMKHVKIIKGVVNEAARRAAQLQGYPLFAASDDSAYATKEDDPIVASLKELNASLDAPSGRSTLSKLEELNAKIGVDIAMANLLTATSE